MSERKKDSAVKEGEGGLVRVKEQEEWLMAQKGWMECIHRAALRKARSIEFCS